MELDLQETLDRLNAIQSRNQNTKVFVKVNADKLFEDLKTGTDGSISYQVDKIAMDYANRITAFINKLPGDFDPYLRKEIQNIRNVIRDNLSDRVVSNVEICAEIPYYGSISEIECVMNETFVQVEL